MRYPDWLSSAVYPEDMKYNANDLVDNAKSESTTGNLY